MKNKTVLTGCAIICILCSGCGVFAPHTQNVTITTEPEGARVTVNGNSYMSPVQTDVCRDLGVSILVRKEGYYAETAHCGTHLSTYGVLDILGGCIVLFPAVGLFAPGAYSLDQTNFNIVLTPKK